jgi:hypothetical protein
MKPYYGMHMHILISQLSRMFGVRLVTLCDMDKHNLEKEVMRAVQGNATIDTYIG